LDVSLRLQQRMATAMQVRRRRRLLLRLAGTDAV
jgi:hypothetical protein